MTRILNISLKSSPFKDEKKKTHLPKEYKTKA